MTLGEDLQRLADLHQGGALSDDEFQRAKARLLDAAPQASGSAAPAGDLKAAINALRRSRADRWLGGVCGGLTDTTGVAAWFWRLVFVLLATLGGTGVLLYGLAWVLLPSAEAPASPAHGYRAG